MFSIVADGLLQPFRPVHASRERRLREVLLASRDGNRFILLMPFA
jgi:hypothetical protein